MRVSPTESWSGSRDRCHSIPFTVPIGHRLTDGCRTGAVPLSTLSNQTVPRLSSPSGGGITVCGCFRWRALSLRQPVTQEQQDATPVPYKRFRFQFRHFNACSFFISSASPSRRLFARAVLRFIVVHADLQSPAPSEAISNCFVLSGSPLISYALGVPC